MHSLVSAAQTISLPGLIALAVILIYFGVLIPAPQHKKLLAIQDKRIQKLEEIIEKKDEQLRRALDGVGRSADSLESIQRAPAAGGDG